MTDKQDVIAELVAGYDGFRSKIVELPDSAYDETWLGTWNLSQVLAHMTGWYGEMSEAIARVGRGEPPAPAGVNYGDSDSWNARFELDAKPGRAALRTWDAAFAAYRHAAAALPDAQFGVDPEKGRPRIGNRLLQAAGVHHFEEHGPQLEAWLASRGK